MFDFTDDTGSQPYGADNLHFDQCGECGAEIEQMIGLMVCPTCVATICSECESGHLERDAQRAAEAAELERLRKAMYGGEQQRMGLVTMTAAGYAKAKQQQRAARVARAESADSLWEPQNGRLWD